MPNPPRVPMHGVAGPLVEVGRLLGRAPDGCQAEPSVDGKARQHVQHHPGPGSSVKMEAFRSDRADHGIWRESEPRLVDEGCLSPNTTAGCRLTPATPRHRDRSCRGPGG